MQASSLKLVLKELVLKTNLTPLIWGIRGIGKSQITTALTKELEETTQKPWGFVDLRISTQEISDLTGIPKAFTWVCKNTDGKEEKIAETAWCVPIWFPTEAKVLHKNIPENGIIFLDEINRGGPQETQAIFQFVLDKRIHTHRLAPGWKIIAAANPPTEEYLVNEIDDALLDRFVQLLLEPDTIDWLDWAKKEGNILEDIIRFIATQPDLLFEISEDEQSWTPPITSSPRAWECLNNIRKSCHFPPEVETEVYAGLIGNTAAIAFQKFIENNYEKPITAYEIMKDYPRIQNKIKHITQENKIDQLNFTIQDLIRLAKINPHEFNIENFFAFFMDLRNDLKVSLVHSLMEIDNIYKLLNNHDSLVNEISKILEEVG